MSFASSRTHSPSSFRLQAGLTEVANAATVSLIEAQGGNTVASSVTDEKGGFVLTFQNFTPVSGAPYTLEAVKGLAVGGKPNRPGAAAVRVRSLLFWNGGWQSLTNSVPGVGISVSPATTAVATIASLKLSARQSLDLTELVGKVSGGNFDASGTDLSRTADFDPVVRLVDNALTLDQDPVGAIAYDPVRGTYRLATGVPLGVGIEPAIPTPGGMLTVRGLNFDPTPGRQVFWFGNVPAPTWSVSPDRAAATVAVPANAVSARFELQQPGGVTVNLAGSLTFGFLKLAGTVGTISGTGAAFADGPIAAARFHRPLDFALDAAGNLYVADLYNHRIRKIDLAGSVSTLAGSGVGGHADGPGMSAQFNGPHGVAADAAGNVYVADYWNQRVRKVSPGGQVSTLAGTGVAGYADGIGSVAMFNQPTGVAVDPAGNVYVTDRANHRIRKIAPDGVVTTLAGSGDGWVDGSGASARLSGPTAIAMDSSGNLVVAEVNGNKVRKVTPGGQVTTLAGSVQGFAEGPGAQAKFNYPYGIATDRAGNVYVGDALNNRVRKIDPSGNVTTLAGNGIADRVDGPLTAASINHPFAMEVGADGVVYVGEEDGCQCIRVITP